MEACVVLLFLAASPAGEWERISDHGESRLLVVPERRGFSATWMYKSFDGSWQASGDKSVFTLRDGELIEHRWWAFVKEPTNHRYVWAWWDQAWYEEGTPNHLRRIR